MCVYMSAAIDFIVKATYPLVIKVRFSNHSMPIELSAGFDGSLLLQL